VLWEIKTDQFDTYSDFLQEQVVREQVPEMLEERDIAAACGYGFVVGVSSEAHQAALKDRADTLDIVVTGCKR
jgi:predicted Rossmann fold nucleotide-binding protein DprA/Smf involved in DNA uptake